METSTKTIAISCITDYNYHRCCLSCGGKKKTLNYTPGLFFQPAEVSTCVVVLAEALTPGSAAGCHGVRDRAPRPGSAAQSVGDHAPGWNSDTV